MYILDILRQSNKLKLNTRVKIIELNFSKNNSI